MGNRGLETRNSKRSTQGGNNKKELQQQPQQQTTLLQMSGANLQPVVGALKVKNVEDYYRNCTLPKGDRIGAYLESLRQTNNGDVNPNQTVPSETNTIPLPNNNIHNNSLSPRPGIKTQPQMIRSNSSGGVTMANSATASLSKLQRHRTTTDGSMMVFSSFRGTSSSPKRSLQPTLADLEFPPPPLDLPPPPEEFENPINNDGELTPFKQSTLVSQQQHQAMISSTINSLDVSNTEPSVEEASTRFGVSLRKREPSTDSCSSLGSPADAIDATNMALKDKLDFNKQKLTTTITTDVPKLNNNCFNSNNPIDPVTQLVNELAETIHLPPPPIPPPVINNKIGEPIYKTADSQHQSLLTSYRKISNASQASSSPPQSQQTPITTNNVSYNKVQLKKVDAKGQTIRSNTNTSSVSKPEQNEPKNIIDFKSRLRKVENNIENNDPNNETITTDSNKQQQQAIDDNSKRLVNNSIIQHDDKYVKKTNDNMINNENGELNNKFKKSNQTSDCISNNNVNNNKNELKKTEIKLDIVTNNHNNSDENLKKRESLEGNSTKNASAPNAATLDAEHNNDLSNDKRKSTGSISSLKKLWEAKEGSTVMTNPSSIEQSQLSPKLGIKNVKMSPNNTDSDENNDQHPHQQQYQHHSHPPLHHHHNPFQHHLSSGLPPPTSAPPSHHAAGNKVNKPAVPIKPTKLSSIYATPIQIQQQQKITDNSISTGPANAISTAATTTVITNNSLSNAGSTTTITPTSNREGILELINLLEINNLAKPTSISMITPSQWLQLSDKLNVLHNTCAVFADNEAMPPHSKFHFRELLTRVETQSHLLRSAGSNKNLNDNEKLINDVGQSLKQITNALHR